MRSAEKDPQCGDSDPYDPAKDRTYFQSLAMKYCSSSSRCSQSSTIFSVYRCSIRHDRILQNQQNTLQSSFQGSSTACSSQNTPAGLKDNCSPSAKPTDAPPTGDSHGISTADVLAGRLDDGLTGLVKCPVNAIVGTWVGFLDQYLKLETKNENKTVRKSCR